MINFVIKKLYKTIRHLILIDIITIDYIRINEKFADLFTKDLSRYQVVKSPTETFVGKIRFWARCNRHLEYQIIFQTIHIYLV